MTTLLWLWMFACGRPVPDGPPNILLISMDTVRSDHLSAYGYERETSPYLDMLAAQGVVFENSFSVANESAYSHAAMFTGRYASELALPDYRTYALPDESLFISEILGLYGYETAAFIAGGHVSDDFGFDQGFDRFSSEEGFASFWHTSSKALGWLDERVGSEAPWFMVLHGYDAHRPFVGPAPFHHLFGEGGGSVIAETIVKHGSETERVYDRVYYPNSSMKWFWHPSGIQILEPEVYERVRVASAMTEGIALTDDDVEHIQAHYDSMVAYADLQLGLFFSAAERSGYLDNTIVIVTGDHGEDLLDHKYVNHRTALTDSCIRVPMIVMGPGFPSGARSTAMVDALDLVPTILEASGAAPPAGLSGQSLQDSVDGQGSETVFVEGVLNMIAVRTRSHKLIYSGTPLKTDGYEDRLAKAALTGGSFELYDVTSDPGELHDRLASPEAEDLALAEDLRVQLVAWRRSIQRGTHRGDPEAVDPRLRKEMQEHGYWEMGEDQSADPGEDQPAETTEAGDEP